MGLIILFAVLAAIGVGILLLELRRKDVFFSIVYLIILTFAIAISLSVIVFGSIMDVNRYVAFYDANAEVYEQAVDAIREGVLVGEDGYILDTAHFEQIQAYKQVVVDLRDEVVAYNKGIVSHTYWQNSGFIGLLVRNMPNHLVLIDTE